MLQIINLYDKWQLKRIQYKRKRVSYVRKIYISRVSSYPDRFGHIQNLQTLGGE